MWRTLWHPHRVEAALPLSRFGVVTTVVLGVSASCAPSRAPEANAAPPDVPEVSAAFEPSSVSIGGEWTATQASAPYGHLVQLIVSRRDPSGHSRVDVTPETIRDLDGLTRALVEAPDSAVGFTRRRDAGTITFVGRFRAGRGAGTYEFAPNLAFFREVQTEEERAVVDDEKMFLFAHHDLTRRFIQEMKGLGYADLSLDGLLELRAYRATPEMIREWTRLGYGHIPKAQLLELLENVIHPGYAYELASHGYFRVPLPDLVALKKSGVTAQFIRRVNAQGDRNRTVAELLQAKRDEQPAGGTAR
jgi:hypothetical protein